MKFFSLIGINADKRWNAGCITSLESKSSSVSIIKMGETEGPFEVSETLEEIF